MEKRSGLHGILSFPAIYDWFQLLAGYNAAKKKLVAEIVQPAPRDLVLDIGCGTGDWLKYLGDVRYFGFDTNREYISAATRKLPQATFACCGIADVHSLRWPKFDIVIAMGVLHHLEDNEARELFMLAYSKLKPGGRFVSHDPCYDPRQSTAARAVVRFDRGKNVRTREELVGLAETVFSALNA